jgi:hypothetical protein
MGRFNEKDFQFAQAWRPTASDILEGTVVERSSRVTDYGEYPILTLETEAGRIKGGELVSGEVACMVYIRHSRTRLRIRTPSRAIMWGFCFRASFTATMPTISTATG